ncbi:hypothetical protein M404DRAFT_1003391 [Pisolithus tinctorius Marx 270]|uniref:Uncharacterized protein n=1 Tax=Pisolithus tinctorius Marx 270 TaxID=870435 RepID=A0A0C3P175_PISTI|nr:hypothetical protein M404DRAFT_1003391 [Pisolithus tinctorius Marx 270]
MQGRYVMSYCASGPTNLFRTCISSGCRSHSKPGQIQVSGSNVGTRAHSGCYCACRTTGSVLLIDAGYICGAR